MKKMFFAAFAAVFALLAVGCGWGGVIRSAGWSEGNTVQWKDTTLLDGQYAGVRTIRVAQSIFPVRILPGTSDSVSVVCYAGQMKVNVPDYKIGVRQDGGVLEIYQTPKDGVVCRQASGCYLELRVPASVREVDIQGVSGGIYAEGVSLDRLKAQTVSGGVKVSGVNAEQMNLSTVSGGVELSQVRGKWLTCKTVSGGIRAEALSADQMEGETVSGGVKVYLEDSAQEVSLESVSGGIDVYLKGDLGRNGYDLKATSGGVRVAGVGESRRHFESEGQSGGVRLKAKTVSGGVDVRSW